MPDEVVVDSSNGDAVATSEVLDAIIGRPDAPVEKIDPIEKIDPGDGALLETGDIDDKIVDDDPIEEEVAEEAEDDEDEEEVAAVADQDIELTDDVVVEVMVDGSVQEVSFKELKADFSGRKFVEQNIQQAVEKRKEVEQHAGNLFQNNKVLIDRLKRIDAALSAHSQPQVDWERLKQEDPQQYILRKEEVRDAQDKQRAVQGELDKTNQEQATLNADALKRYTANEADLLVKVIPEFGDPTKSKDIMGGIASTAGHYGFTPQELGNITDHRVIVALHDLMTLQQVINEQDETSRQVDKKVKTRKRIKLPNSARKPQRTSAAKALQRAVQRAQKSGKPDDVAATLLVQK